MFDERPITSDLYVEGPTPARYWGDQWLRVAEKVLKGLNHDFTNRVTSLEAAVGVFDPGEKPPESMVRAVSDEVLRLHGLLNLYRMLTSEALKEPEAIRLQDLLPEVVRLHEHHADLRQLPCELAGDMGALPVLVRPSALVRCVLVLLASAAGNTLRAQSKEPVEVRFGGDAEEVFLRIIGAAPRDQLLFTGEGSLVHAVRAALAHAWGAVDGVVQRRESGDRIEYDLRLPTLTAARARASAAD